MRYEFDISTYTCPTRTSCYFILMNSYVQRYYYLLKPFVIEFAKNQHDYSLKKIRLLCIIIYKKKIVSFYLFTVILNSFKNIKGDILIRSS